MTFYCTADNLLYALLQQVTGQSNPTVMTLYSSTTEDLIASINAAIAAGAMMGTPEFFTATEGQTDFTPSRQPLSNTPVYVDGERNFDWTIVGALIRMNYGMKAGERVVIIM